MDVLKAIRGNDIRKIQKRLTRGFDVNKPIQEYNKNKELVSTIPLSLAAARGYKDIVELLLAYGANIHACNLDWSSPLHLATFHGHHDVIACLVQRNVNLNNSDQHGNTVLHLAAKNNNMAAAILFLENNIDVQVRNNNGQTALQLATQYCHYGIAESITNKIKSTTKPSPTPKKITVEITQTKTKEEPIQPLTQKERLQRQLEQLEMNELNSTVKDKRTKHKTMSDELENLNTQAIEIRTQITQLEGRLKDVNLKKLNKEKEIKKIESELEILDKQKNNKKESKRISMMETSKNYECPICFEIPFPPRKVFQCSNGHVYCSDCKQKPGMSICPQCRIPLNQRTAIRNLVYEEILAKKACTNGGSL